MHPIRLLALFLLTLSAGAAPAGETALERAVADFQAGRFSAVVAARETLPQDAHERARVQYLVGEALLVLDRFEEAERAFADALSARPKAVPALVGRGRALTGLGRFDDAGAPLKAALELERGDVGARVALGELALAKGDLEGARERLGEAHAAAPDDALAARAWFEVLLRSGSRAEAAELAESLIARRPQHPLGDFLLAVVMEQDGDDRSAQAQYLRALELDPTFLDAHKNLAILCHTLSQDYTDKERAKLAYDHYAAYFRLGGGDAHLRALYDELLKYEDQILGA
jgi:tetratricopeptide (TPR) repeat protein